MIEIVLAVIFSLVALSAIIWLYYLVFLECFGKKGIKKSVDWEEITDKAMNALKYLFLFSLFGGGLGIVVSQIYLYSKSGDWIGISVISGLEYLGSNWAYYPTDWIGVHDQLDKAPLSITLIVLGIMWLMVSKD